jgi:hypothetical protein
MPSSYATGDHFELAGASLCSASKATISFASTGFTK